jgi:hypothetical protein
MFDKKNMLMHFGDKPIGKWPHGPQRGSNFSRGVCRKLCMCFRSGRTTGAGKMGHWWFTSGMGYRYRILENLAILDVVFSSAGSFWRPSDPWNPLSIKIAGISGCSLPQNIRSNELITLRLPGGVFCGRFFYLLRRFLPRVALASCTFR